MRTATKLLTTALLLVGAGCGHKSDSSGDSTQFIDGFNPPAPQPGDIRIVTPIYEGIQPGADILYCSYIQNPFPQDMDVTASVGMLSKWGHHAVLYDVLDAGTVGDTHVCTDNDMNRARLLGGAVDAAQNFPIPDGIAIRVHASSHMMIQTHWLNAGTETVRGQGVFNITAKIPDGTRDPAQSLTVYTTNFMVKSEETGHAMTECPIQTDLKMFFLAAHEHAWGSHIKIERVVGDQATAIIDSNWIPEYATNPPRNNYTKDQPLLLNKGDKLRVTCDWMNSTDHAMTFPEEMCVGFGMFFPAEQDVDCGDGQWSGPM